MKKIIKFRIYRVIPGTRIRANRVADDVFQTLSAQFPERFVSPAKNSLQFEFEEGSDELRKVQQVLESVGLKLKWNPFPSLRTNEPSNLIQVEGQNIIEEKDVLGAEYFWFRPLKGIAALKRHLTEGVEIDPESIKGEVELGAPIPSWATLCKESFKKAAGKEGFSGLTFRSVSGCDSLFELWSDLVLPPVRNPLIGQDGSEPREDRSNGCWVDSCYQPWILRLAADEVDQMGDFDFALTRERWIVGVGMYPIKIVSGRFREWSVARGISAEWVPVEIV